MYNIMMPNIQFYHGNEIVCEGEPSLSMRVGNHRKFQNCLLKSIIAFPKMLNC